MPTGYGFAGFGRRKPFLDAAIVTRLKAIGGVIAGKTVTTPFAFLDPPPTAHPLSAAHTPGGSSSGSAAAVAAGMLPIALGSQTGGSIIRPASYCGVAAIKPSFRLLPLTGVKQTSWSLDTLGLFAARVVDCAFALEAISGRPMLETIGTLDVPRFGLLRQSWAGTPAPEAEAAIDRARRALEAAGAKVAEATEPEAIILGAAAGSQIYDYELAVCLAPDRQRFGARLPPKLAAALARGAGIEPAAYDSARRIARRARLAAKELFDGFDAS